MFIHPDISIEESIHNLINLHLFPECLFLLGQKERYSFRDGDISLQRTGNPHSTGKDAVTYRYRIAGPGFVVCLQAIWHGEDQATADVDIISIGPDLAEGHEAFREWLVIAVDARMPPRDAFVGMPLS